MTKRFHVPVLFFFALQLAILLPQSGIVAKPPLPEGAFGATLRFNPYDYLPLGEVLALHAEFPHDYWQHREKLELDRSTERWKNYCERTRRIAHDFALSGFGDSALRYINLARSYAERIPGSTKLLSLQLMQSQAFVYGCMAKHDSAHSVFRRAIQRYHGSGELPLKTYIYLCNGLANSFRELGFPDSAHIWYNKAHTASAQHKSPYTSYFHALTSMHSAGTLLRSGSYIRALDTIKHTFRLMNDKNVDTLTLADYSHRIPAEQHLLFEATSLRAAILYKLYTYRSYDILHLINSILTYSNAADLLNTYRNDHQAVFAESYIRNQAARLFPEAVSAAVLAAEKTANKDYLHRAFRLAEQHKQIRLWSAFIRSGAPSIAGIPDSLLQQEQQLCRELLRRDSIHIPPGTNGSNLDRNRKAFAKVRQQLQTDYPNYHARKYRSITVSAAELLAVLPEHSAVLSYVANSDELIVFVLYRRNIQALRLQGATEMRNAVETFFDAIRRNQGVEVLEKGYALYEALFEPAEDMLPTGITDLVIAPDDFLYSLPFEALHSGRLTRRPSRDFGHYNFLIRSYSISRTFSADEYWRALQTPPQPAHNSYYGFAPAYRQADVQNARSYFTSLPFAPQPHSPPLAAFDAALLARALPYTPEEIEASALAFRDKAHQVRVRTGSDATLTELRSAARITNYLHIAAHCFYYREAPGLSGLALGSETQTVLSSREIYALLPEIRLMVLSNCDCRDGDIISDQAIMTMSGPQLYRPESGTLLSLWKISSRHTAGLMREFYEHHLNGMSSARSLQAAKLSLLVERESAHPVHWATMVYFGL